MSIFVPVEQVPPVAIRTLAEGDRFSLWWDSESGYHETQIKGEVLYIRPGYARVRISYRDENDPETTSLKYETTEWSAGTLVIKEDAMAETTETTKGAKKGKLAPAPEKGKDKGAKAETAKAPKAAKTKNPCLCGCGELVGNRFRPGHDARWYSQLAKINNGDAKFSSLSKESQKLLGDMSGVKKAIADHKRPPSGEAKGKKEDA